MTPRHAPRGGVTLVELLVVISILTGLLALALMLIPNVNQKNAVQKAAGEIQSAFKTAQGLATVAKLPRGVRFLVNNGYFASQIQYLEMPPIIISDTQALVGINGDTTGQYTSYGPRVEFTYALAPAPTGMVTTAQNTITLRHCYIRGLTLDQANEVLPGATLVIPPLGAFSRVTSTSWILPASPLTSSVPGPPAPGPYTYTSPRTSSTAVDLEAVLDVYPDNLLGTATTYRTYQFGIYSVPVPLLGEPTVPLPQGIAADLQISYPPLTTPLQNYDVVFSPAGPTVPSLYPSGPVASGTPNVAGNTNVYIWVRDTTPTTNPLGTNKTSMNGQYPMAPGDFPTAAAYAAAFPLAGEQLIVGVRAGGFVGVAPVNWPPTGGASPGVYPAFQDPFSLARQQLGK